MNNQQANSQTLKIDVKEEEILEEIPLPPYKAAEHFYRLLQARKKSWAPLSSCWTIPVSTMFPRSTIQEIAVAKEICTTCPVTRECLKLALVNQEEYGVWGGYSSKDIQGLIKEIKNSFGNIWISWDSESENIIDTFVAKMAECFIEENGINEVTLQDVFTSRLNEIDFRLSSFKL